MHTLPYHWGRFVVCHDVEEISKREREGVRERESLRREEEEVCVLGVEKNQFGEERVTATIISKKGIFWLAFSTLFFVEKMQLNNPNFQINSS